MKGFSSFVAFSNRSNPDMLVSSAGVRETLQRWESGNEVPPAPSKKVALAFHAPGDVAELARTESAPRSTKPGFSAPEPKNPAIVRATILHKAHAALVAALRRPQDGIPLPQIATAVKELFVFELQQALSEAVSKERLELETLVDSTKSSEMMDTSSLAAWSDPELNPSAAELLLELTRWKKAWPDLFEKKLPDGVRDALRYIGEDLRTTLSRIQELDGFELSEEAHTFAPYLSAATAWGVGISSFPLTLGLDSAFGGVGAEDLRALSIAYEMKQFPGVSSPAPAPLGRLLDAIEAAERLRPDHFLSITTLKSAVSTLEAIAWNRVRSALARLAGSGDEAILRAGPMAVADLEEVLTRPGEWPERLGLTSPEMKAFVGRAKIAFHGETTRLPEHLRDRFSETLERAVARLLSTVQPGEMNIDGGGLVVCWARDALERGVTLANSEMVQWQIRQVADALEGVSSRIRAQSLVMRSVTPEWRSPEWVSACEQDPDIFVRSKTFALQLVLFIELVDLCTLLRRTTDGSPTDSSISQLDLLGEQGSGLQLFDRLAGALEGPAPEHLEGREKRKELLLQYSAALAEAQQVIENATSAVKDDLVLALRPKVAEVVHALKAIAEAERAEVLGKQGEGERFR